jgi:energy-coupling factor transporter ATP-binding protein EcfA2
MAYIEQFTIENLAGRTEPYAAVLNRDVNVFYGLNGSGKTTLLKILHSALSTETDILEDLPFTRARAKIYLNRYHDFFVRTIDQPEKSQTSDSVPLSTLSANQGNLWRNSLSFNISHLDWDSPLAGRPAWTSDPEEPDQKLKTNSKGSILPPRLTPYGKGFLSISRLYRNVNSPTGAKRLSDQELDNAFARGLQGQWSQYYADISKQITKVQERGLANILGFFLAGGDDQGDGSSAAPNESEAYKRIDGFLNRQPGFGHVLPAEKEFSALYKKRRELRNVVKQIEEVEKNISEITSPRERFRTVLESMFSGNKYLVFTEKEIKVELGKNREIGLSLLSSGEKQLLYIALHVLVSGDSTLIIDEPELSMHVDWQRKLVSSLTALNPRMQLIIATHSPEIMADIPDSKIFAL